MGNHPSLIQAPPGDVYPLRTAGSYDIYQAFLSR